MINNLEAKLSGLEQVNRDELIELISSWGRNDESEFNDEIIYECEPAECYPLENLDVSQIENLSYVFIESNYNGDLSKWNLSNCKNINRMFSFSLFNNDSISNWNLSNVETMQYMFYYSDFSGDISSWKFNKNTDIDIDCDYIFEGNDKFIEKYNSNQDINYTSNSFLKWFEENKEKMKEINKGDKEEILDFFSFNNDLNIEKEKL